MLLKGKIAVITGCSRGIGKEILKVFAQNGSNIWACTRKPNLVFENEVNELSEKYNVLIKPLYFNLEKLDEIKQAMKKIIESKQKVDILVNNAGITSPNALFFMSSIEMMKKVFEVNFFSQIVITQSIARLMSKYKSGTIINVASIAGIDGDPGQLEYVSSKAALIGATKKLAIELAKYNIRVNAVAPGIIQTDMINRMSVEMKEYSILQTKMKRLGQPDEVANTVLFLATEMSSFLTGQVLRVDGGR